MTIAPQQQVDFEYAKYGFRDEEHYTYKSEKGLNEQVVRTLSRMKGEPAWMLARRLKALAIYVTKPVPLTGMWANSKLAELDDQDIYYYVRPGEKSETSWDDVPQTIRTTFEKLGIPEAEQKFLAGVGAQYESESVYHSLRAEWEKLGVIFLDMDAALREYPEIVKEHMIIDIGAARLAAAPERFDVVVTPNLYGDIVSDIAAEVAGSVGLAGSANIGAHGAMFEAIHGSAPDIAGQGIANPSGLILAGVQMLQHLGQADIAERIHNAWLKTIEDGLHTADIAGAAVTKRRVGTTDFADGVIARLGEEPKTLKAVRYKTEAAIPVPAYVRPSPAEKILVGVDVFVHSTTDVDTLAEAMQAAQNGAFSLKLITNRGVKVWPQGLPETFCTDHWRCRFEAKPGKQLTKAMVAELLMRLAQDGVDFVKTEHLFTFDGKPGYSLGQGE